MKRQLRITFADMTFDEFNEPMGQPCRSSCGCRGACDEGQAQAAIFPIFLVIVDVSPELFLKVKNIKAKCDNERKKAVANRLAGSEPIIIILIIIIIIIIITRIIIILNK